MGMLVKFRVLEILDKRQSNSSLEIGKIYIGKRDKNRQEVIWWIDPMNEQEWVFYDGDTCEVLEELEQLEML